MYGHVTKFLAAAHQLVAAQQYCNGEFHNNSFILPLGGGDSGNGAPNAQPGCHRPPAVATHQPDAVCWAGSDMRQQH